MTGTGLSGMWLPTPETGSPAAGMDAGDYTFGLDFPPCFQRDGLAGRLRAIQLNVDATRMTQAFTGSGHIQQNALGEVNDFVQHYRSSLLRRWI
jgi:ABC-2 type transport system permease protein